MFDIVTPFDGSIKVLLSYCADMNCQERTGGDANTGLLQSAAIMKLVLI